MLNTTKHEWKYFRTEGVVVHFPGQPQPVLVERLKLPELSSMPSVPGGFQPIRPVINLKVKLASEPDKVVNVFSPPITVRVRYKVSDEAEANRRGKPLSLGYWDGKEWIRCTFEDHGFRLTVAKSGQYAGWGTVNITTWGDPTKAWGT